MPSWILAWLTFLTILPVTLVVTVLKPLVQDRFGVMDLGTSGFMSINMVGAFIAAPLAGSLADRLGQRRPLVVAALLADAALLLALPAAPSYAILMGLRFLEGAAHIVALSLIMGVAADLARHHGSGRLMGIVGATLTFGVAIGAPLGGVLGKTAPNLPLQAGAALAVLAAGFAFVFLREIPGHRASPSLGRVLALTLKNRDLRVPCAFAFVDRFTVGFFVSAFSLYVQKVHGGDTADAGLLLAWFLLPFAALCYPMGRLAQKTSLPLLIGGGSLLYGIGVSGTAVVHLAWVPALMATLGILSSVMFVPTLMLAQRVARPGLATSAMGAFNAAGSLGFVLGPLVAGGVSDLVASRSDAHTGYAAAFIVAGLSEILCVLATLPALRRLATSFPAHSPTLPPS
jgi:MFS family permease